MADDYGRGRAEPVTLYAASNAVERNEILSFVQDRDGSIRPTGSTRTGGTGTAGGLGNQSGLVLSPDEEHLLVVNAGSNDISVFQIRERGLRLVSVTPSGGTRPVSIALDRDLVYVLNAGSDSISGFELSEYGRLHPIAGSYRELSGTGVNAAQVAFSPDGRTLVVTERATNNIVAFPLDRAGVARDRVITPSIGQTPFGFSFNRRRQLVVSEAAGGAANASSVSSYRLARDGSLTVLDPSEATLQSAACWVVITSDQRYAYASNTGSNTISGFEIRGNGQLQPLSGDGITASTGDGPIDLALTSDSEFLYSLNGRDGTINGFAIGRGGQLTAVGEVGGLPVNANGLVARR